MSDSPVFRLPRRLRHLSRLGFVVAVIIGVAQPVTVSRLQADPLRIGGDGGAILGPASGTGADVAVTLVGLRAAVAEKPVADPASAPLDAIAGSVAELDRQLALVGAQAEAAGRQLAVAEVDRTRLRASVATTEQRIEALRREVTDRAVDLYMSPRADVLAVFGAAPDLQTSVRRQGLLRTLIEADERAVDRLQIARQDLLALQAQLDRADRQAAVMSRTVTDARSALDAAGTARTEVAASLAQRVAGLDAEILGQQRGETALLKVLSTADLAAEEAASRRLSMPIDAPITSEFGPRWGRMHSGVDFESDIGVPIRAAKSGVVLEADWLDGYGQVIVIDHGGGLTTLYAHQSAFAVSAGQRVERGQLIGYVGVTGNSTGPHLHFETREGNTAVDPRKYLS